MESEPSRMERLPDPEAMADKIAAMFRLQPSQREQLRALMKAQRAEREQAKAK